MRNPIFILAMLCLFTAFSEWLVRSTWLRHLGTALPVILITTVAANELIRFNEAMDQSLTEAIRWFNEELGRMRDTFVGVLGHDLRDPLSAALTANELQRLADGEPDVQRKANETADRNLQRM